MLAASQAYEEEQTACQEDNTFAENRAENCKVNQFTPQFVPSSAQRKPTVENWLIAIKKSVTAPGNMCKVTYDVNSDRAA